jgi:energy-coupling factor transporter ATP-binding protein EcfA2
MIADVTTPRRASDADAPDAYWRRLGCRQDPCATLAPGSVFAGPGFVQLQHALFKALRTSPGGLTLLTGPEGVGKTTFLQTIVDALRTVGETVIFHRCGPDRQLLEADLAAVADDRGKRNPILLLDGADAWDDAAVAAFERALSRPEAPPLTARIVVVFRLDNDPRLNRVTSLALASGVPFARLRVEPLEAGSAGDFLLHRMRAAGYAGSLPIAPATMARIEAESGGLPSRLLVLASVELARIAEPRASGGGARALERGRGFDFPTLALRVALGTAVLAAVIGAGVGILLSPTVRPERDTTASSLAMPSVPQSARCLRRTRSPPRRFRLRLRRPPSSPFQAPQLPAVVVAAPAAPPPVEVQPAFVEPPLVPLSGPRRSRPTRFPARCAWRWKHSSAARPTPCRLPVSASPTSASALLVAPHPATPEPIAATVDEKKRRSSRRCWRATRPGAKRPSPRRSCPRRRPSPRRRQAYRHRRRSFVDSHGDPDDGQIVVAQAPPPEQSAPMRITVVDPSSADADQREAVVHIAPAAGPSPLVKEDALLSADGVVVQPPPPAPASEPPPLVTAPHLDPPPAAVVIEPPPAAPRRWPRPSRRRLLQPRYRLRRRPFPPSRRRHRRGLRRLPLPWRRPRAISSAARNCSRPATSPRRGFSSSAPPMPAIARP